MTPAERDLWEQLAVSDAGLAKLRDFAAMVERWTQRINLIARSTVPEIWSRHVLDSAQLCLLAPQAPRRWVDLGSGGGFPGVVVAAILQDRGSATEVILVESDLRKATFLREAARQLSVRCQVVAERIEAVPPQDADVLSARALAALDVLCAHAARHLAADGVALFPKGEMHEQEIAVARQNWLFDLETHENLDHKGGAILALRTVRRAPR